MTVMNSKQKKQAEALAALSAEDLARLGRLAALANITPEQLWQDVWLYGFDDVEEGIQADLEADEYFKTNDGIDHAEVMAQALRIVESHDTQKLLKAFAELPASGSARLEALAALAGSSAEEIWPAVYRYGFQDMEESVQADLDAQAEHAEGRTVPHEEVMANAQRLIDDYGKQRTRGTS